MSRKSRGSKICSKSRSESRDRKGGRGSRGDMKRTKGRGKGRRIRGRGGRSRDGSRR